MTTKKQPAEESAAGPSLAGRLVHLVRGEHRGPLALGLALIGFVVTVALVWRSVRDTVLSGPDYMVTAEQVEATPRPDYLHTDVAGDVIRALTLDRPLSITDDQLSQRLYQAFSAHPWVERVERVVKQHPARVQVDLVYRRPVCMIEVPAGVLPGRVEIPGGLLPVDVRGVLLPDVDFSAEQRSRYPRVVGIGSTPAGSPGTAWGDDRVSGAAEVAGVLVDVWGELGLDRIVPSTEPLSSGSRAEYTFQILTKGGTTIRWGRSPRTQAPGEVPAVEKVARLRNYVRDHGSLDHANSPEEIDVRQWREAKIIPRRTATVPERDATSK